MYGLGIFLYRKEIIVIKVSVASSIILSQIWQKCQSQCCELSNMIEFAKPGVAVCVVWLMCIIPLCWLTCRVFFSLLSLVVMVAHFISLLMPL